MHQESLDGEDAETRRRRDLLGGHAEQAELVAESVAGEGWAAVQSGKPVCVPGPVNKVLSHLMRPVSFRAQYVLGRTLNPFKH